MTESLAIQFLAANVARFQVLTDLDALFNTRAADHCVIEIARQLVRTVLHFIGHPCPWNLPAGTCISGDRKAVNVSADRIAVNPRKNS